MNYEEIRAKMKKETVAHRHTTGPANRWSTNRLNSLASMAAKKEGLKAAIELHKEFTSKKR